jgi:hypothetical protein
VLKEHQKERMTVRKKKKESEEARSKADEAGGERIIKLVIPEELSFLFSEEVMGHLVSAKREMLLALKGIIEHKLELLDKRAKKSEKVKTIKIEVE